MGIRSRTQLRKAAVLPCLAVVASLAVAPPALARSGAEAGPAARSPGLTSELYGVSEVSPTDVSTVGVYKLAYDFLTLIEHSDGSRWTKVFSPTPGKRDNGLYGVSAVSATDAWAVGSYYQAHQKRGSTLILHSDGVSWTKVPSPNPAGTGESSTLKAVSARTAADAWAVGGHQSSGGLRAIATHWDGTSWALVPTADLGTGAGSSTLTGVSAVNANDAWAVGYYYDGATKKTLAEHWDGAQWSKVSSPSPGGVNGSGLSSVSSVSVNDAWAVGSYNDGTVDKTLVEHWDGAHWGRVTSVDPSVNLNTLSAVSADSGADVWVVGVYATADWVARTLIEHWDGATWSIVPSPNRHGPFGTALYGVSASGAGSATAVGLAFDGTANQAFICRWDGQGWTKS